MPFTQCLDQGFNGRVIACGREPGGDFDKLVGYTPLCRYNNCELIPGLMMFFQDVHDIFDTLRIGN